MTEHRPATRLTPLLSDILRLQRAGPRPVVYLQPQVVKPDLHGQSLVDSVEIFSEFMETETEHFEIDHDFVRKRDRPNGQSDDKGHQEKQPNINDPENPLNIWVFEKVEDQHKKDGDEGNYWEFGHIPQLLEFF